MARVLLVDDDLVVLSALGRCLVRAGHAVTESSSVDAALAAIEETPFDAIVTDLVMPGRSGLDLLRQLRTRDLDVPVLVMTGEPSVDTAMAAIEHRAFRYLRKPIEPKELDEAVRRAASFSELARLKREVQRLAQPPPTVADDLPLRFERALATLWMAFQPIVSLQARRVVAYEALLRTQEPTLQNPTLLIDAAEELSRLHDLGRAIRAYVGHAAQDAPRDVDLFVNVHPADLADEDLYLPAGPLASQARRVVLEITERASLRGTDDAPARLRRLRRLGFRVAVDDLGAGYAGLTSVAVLEPEVVKLDMSLVRGIDVDERRQHLVRSMIGLCRDLRMRVIVEGVETRAECLTAASLGADLMQGYFFARPGAGFAAVEVGALAGDVPPAP